MWDNELPKCAVLGAGTMGAQIAASLALGGAQVTLWARREASLAPALERIGEAVDFLIGQELATAQDKADVLGRVTTTGDLEDAVKDAGFIIEAAAEDVGVKQDLLKRAEAASPGDAVTSSTTSSISATDIQSGLARPARFCVAHYAQPAQLVAVVEVVPGKDTHDDVTEAVTTLLARTGKTPVTCPDVPGFLWVRIQTAVLRELASLVGQGLATPEACDTILKKGYASRLPAMGAFEHADLAGLDLMNSDALKAVWADLSNVTDPAETPLGQLFAQGHTGMRSGQGFYDWTQRDPEAFKAQRDEEIVRRVKIVAGGEVVLNSKDGA